MKYLITGGAGFIGSHYLKMMISKYPNNRYVCIDALTYAGNLKNIPFIEGATNIRFVKGNISNKKLIERLFEEEHFDYVINFAAETHVDKSIANPEIFFKTNVLGTQVLLEACKKYGIKRFHQVSTDEVYGDIPLNIDDYFTEESPLRPSNPYSASKASADLLVLSYHRTYGISVTISRSSNNYGSNQSDDKLIPLVLKKALKNEKIPIYGTGNNVRDWIYVEDHCSAIDLIIKKGRDGEIYNICSHEEKSNLELVKEILNCLGKPESLIEFVKDRAGHDLKYSLSTEKIEKELNWKAQSKLSDKINILLK